MIINLIFYTYFVRYNYKMICRSSIMTTDGPNLLKTIISCKYRIPKYQRDYSWRSKQAIELWTDLIEFYLNKDEDSKYIFGQIVTYISSNKKERYVIDGQQRLTTSYLFLAAAKKMITYIYPDKSKWERIVEKYCNFLDSHMFVPDEEKDEPLLTVSKYNKCCFEKILMLENIEPNVDSENNMISVYSVFIRSMYAYLSGKKLNLNSQDLDDYSVIENNEKCFSTLKSIVNCFLDFIIVDIPVTKLSDAYRIFDTVNTRGIRLGFTDLVKNHIFTKCYETDDDLKDDNYELERLWKDIVSSIKDDFPKFFRYVLIAKYGIIRDDEIMSTVKEKIKDPASIKEFINELNHATNAYLMILNGHGLLNNEESIRILKGLREAKKPMTFHAPVLISFYLKSKSLGHDDKQIENQALELIKAIDVSLIRGLFADKSSNYYEEYFGNSAKKYYSGELTFEEYVDAIRSYGYSDGQLKQILKNKNWENKEARYILTELHNRNYPTNVIKCKTDVEHILPETMTSEMWPDIDVNDHKLYFKKIGNLMLLESGANRGLKNKSFSEKVKKYKEIDDKDKLLDVNKKIVIEKGTWNIDSIDKRTEFIIERILKEWPQNK